ncbi:M48 family metallopeptidase [Rhizobium sp. MC63]|uniref:M48 family metallopeptidase n=1 Tax=Rhizobium mulingense TaxID=3031128 RepID=A0ACC6MZR9_9HYPH|nr:MULTISPECIES: M48 family metallopeptidase [unclassified Rhizobium]MDF0697388.1 M48 family metallopeptidase [Rhizobium sp. MC63]MEA3518236.1 M48 family metallopeptidase [Rhizobium sp. MJ31]MEB3044243.1 M48 family metallopeptidase [Rhizobium sp. MJ21]
MFPLLKTRPKARKPAPPEMRTLDVAGRLMPLTIKHHEQATRITLRIEPGGRALKMTVPKGLAPREVNAFLDRHQGWLLTKLAKFSTDGGLRDGGKILLRGVAHRIEHSGSLRGLTEVVSAAGDEPVLRVSGMPEHLGRRLAAFLKKEARTDLEKLAAMHAATIRAPIRSIALKDTRSRWGSCSSEGNLSFSWRIVMAPPAVIDYLAAHEVAHLKEMNHGPHFWALCRKLCPGMEEAKAWLKRHGSQLHAIDFD